jgi:surfactin synthase thioesterase subunit
VTGMTTAEQDRWLRRFHSCAAGAPQLFCFPHAGGSAAYYFPFSKDLAPGVEVLAVQYPGRQDRRLEPLIGGIPELADRVADVLASVVVPPFAFFGHSMGAIVAFETALRLRDNLGISPSWFFASGRRAPSTKRPRRIYDDADVISEMRRLGGTDPRFLGDEELLTTILPAIRNDYHAVEDYRWEQGVPLACPITVLIGDADPQSTIEEAAAWAEHTTGVFEQRAFPGGHFFLDKHRTDVVYTISVALNETSRIN